MIALRIPPAPKPAEVPAEPQVPELPKEKPKLSTPKFARGLTTLSLSWIHGRMEALAIYKGEVCGSWEATENVDDPSQFERLVTTAVEKTQYRGNTVSLLLAHHRLTHQLVETPPAKGSALATIVRRQVERLKVFDGEPAWCFQPAMATKKSHAVLVHLFPRDLLNQLSAGAERAGMHLTAVIPCSEVLHTQMAQLPLKLDEVALVASESNGLATVVVGRQDGQLLLARSLDAGRASASGGLSVDLNRTLLYVSQQFGVNVGSIWLLGPGSDVRLHELKTQVQIPAHARPDERRPFQWPEEAARLSGPTCPNLITSEQRQAPQRRVAFRIACLVTLAVVLGAAATALVCEVLVRREKRSLRDLEQRAEVLQLEHQNLQRTDASFRQQQQIATAVVDERLLPAPMWFCAYLGEVVPPELLVTNLLVERHLDHWDVRIAGSLQPSTNLPPAGVLSNQVQVLAERLHQGPFKIVLGEPTAPATSTAPAKGVPAPTSPPAAAAAKPTLPSATSGLANWVNRLNSSKNPAPAAMRADRFVLEGTMQ